MMTCPKCLKSFKSHRSLGAHNGRCKLTTEQLFWFKVDRRGRDDCWLWTGALQRDGYAHFTGRDRKTVSSHRYAYENLVGPIPEGMDLLHSCDVRHCCNPSHLRSGTHRENMIDKRDRGRTNARLKPHQVRDIKRAIAECGGRRGINLELAKKYGVSTATISQLKRGTVYGHIE